MSLTLFAAQPSRNRITDVTDSPTLFAAQPSRNRITDVTDFCISNDAFLTAEPPIPPIIPVKKSCWWAGVKTGRFPKPVKFGPRVTAWRVEDIRTLIASV